MSKLVFITAVICVMSYAGITAAQGVAGKIMEHNHAKEVVLAFTG